MIPGKKVLILYYSQSGQLGEIVNNFLLPFEEAGVSVEKVNLKPKKDFDFPWTSKSFFDAMPESVLGIPVELEEFELKETAYDLVIFGYQPWFLSPSIPASSILLNSKIKKILKDAPVVTIIGARNMWLNSQEKVKKLLRDAEAKLVGNIALTDKNGNLVSAVTIQYWLFTGRKDKFLNIFPKPGVSEKDISGVKIFGEKVLQALKEGNWNSLQEKLVALKALEVKPNLMFIESRGSKIFKIWAKVIIRRKNRSLWTQLFKFYLLIALFIVAPIILLINTLIFQPFLGKVINKKKEYYLGLN